MRKVLMTAFCAMCVTGMMLAVPAKRGFVAHTQSDGTVISVEMVGDEFHHGFVTHDGLTVARDANGDFVYSVAGLLTEQLAHERLDRSEAELEFVASQGDRLTMKAGELANRPHRAASRPRKVGQTQVPTMGSPRVPIILVQYADKQMSHTKAQFEAQYRTGAKSVLRYFTDQSNGLYTPQYDVYGIYTLSSSRATYGGNDYWGNDVGVAKMVGEAIDLAGDAINWSQYDNDGDGEADVCIVVYAGVGEAQASYTVPSSVWPCQWELSSGSSYGDGTGARYRNGVKIDRFAVFNETAGSNDNGTTMDGIGTFCHEFSHCLGLPDFYETTYSHGYYGMGGWSLMNSGCYNGGAVDGDTPIGYSAYEKNFMGWIEYIEPQPGHKYTLPIFNNKSLDSDQAIKLTSPLNENEFFVLENRSQQGWDQYIANSGLLITHFTYVADRWSANTVNNYAVQLATVIPADGTLSESSESGDVYGYGNREFTDNSSPAAKLNMNVSGTLASTTGGAGVLGQPVTEITRNSDGTVSLWYMRDAIPVLETPVLNEATSVGTTSFRASWNHEADVPVTYTLMVGEKGDYDELVTESFANFTSATTDIGTSLNNYFAHSGWVGTKVYRDNGRILLGAADAAGKLSTPALDLTNYEGLTTVVFRAAAYPGDTGCQLVISAGSVRQTVELTTTPTTYVVILNCTPKSNQKILFDTKARSKRCYIYDIGIYSGNATSVTYSTPARVQVAQDDYSTTISGIDGLSYVVTGLTPGKTYAYKVKAVPVDDLQAIESDWSEGKVVVMSDGLRGDMNGDGVVDVTDVNLLILSVLNASSELPGGDLNGDGIIDVTDVNLLILMVLGVE